MFTHTHTYTHAHARRATAIALYVQTHTHIHIHKHTYPRTQTFTTIHTHTHTHTLSYRRSAPAHFRDCCTHTLYVQLFLSHTHIHTHVYTYTRTHPPTHTHTRTHAHTPSYCRDAPARFQACCTHYQHACKYANVCATPSFLPYLLPPTPQCPGDPLTRLRVRSKLLIPPPPLRQCLCAHVFVVSPRRMSGRSWNAFSTRKTEMMSYVLARYRHAAACRCGIQQICEGRYLSFVITHLNITSPAFGEFPERKRG